MRNETLWLILLGLGLWFLASQQRATPPPTGTTTATQAGDTIPETGGLPL